MTIMYEVKKGPKILQCENSVVLLRTNYSRKKSKKVIVTNMNDAEILHFNLETRYQNSAEPFFPLNSLKHQQQMDNAEILHFKFDSYKIWMQKFCKAIFPLNSL